MEGFSLLKYWIGGSGGGAASNMRLSSSSSSSCSSTTITTVAPETGDSDDEGPFFDLEFTLPVEEEEDDGGFQEEEEEEQEEGSDDDDRDSTFSSSGTGGGPPRPPAGAAANRSLPDIPFSPSENLFFKGGELMSLEPPSSAPLAHACDTNSKKQFPVSLLRSATKFRVFLLGFKKAKPSSSSSSSSSSTTEAATAKQQQQSSFFTVKFKVEEVPIMSLFRRENSWRSSSCKRHSEDSVEDGMSASEEMKRLLKDVMNKYMKMLRPASGAGENGRKGGGGERHRFSGQLSLLSLGLGGKPTSTSRSRSRSRRNSSISSSSSSSSPSSSWEEEERVKKQQRQGSLREVCRHLSKSRSVSSSTSVAPVATAVVPSPLQSQSQRRDDSLLQQQDGIQSAIAHCKRSLNAPLGTILFHSTFQSLIVIIIVVFFFFFLFIY